LGNFSHSIPLSEEKIWKLVIIHIYVLPPQVRECHDSKAPPVAVKTTCGLSPDGKLALVATLKSDGCHLEDIGRFANAI
jgi:hypothetical protein